MAEQAAVWRRSERPTTGPCPCVVQGLTHEGRVITETCHSYRGNWCRRTVTDLPGWSEMQTALDSLWNVPVTPKATR